MLPLVLPSLVAARFEVDTSTMKNFGHSIKNGHLVANEEILLFSHSCKTPPCTITQMHCPAAGPRWYDAIVRIYVDGDEERSLNFTLLELANIGDPTHIEPSPVSPPNYTEYFLGAMGDTCTDTCTKRGLVCDPHINTGYFIDKGERMVQHLAQFNASIAKCKRDARSWWTPDQPGFVCGHDPNNNTGACLGWKDVPAVDDCDGTYPEMCRVCHCRGTPSPPAPPASGPPGTGDHGPWGTALFGHTANNGGVYSTVRIPFGKSLRATLTAPASGTFWFIIRGVENLPVVLGDMTLPADARLKLHRYKGATTLNELVTLMDVPPATSGALLAVRFDASGKSYGYLEACMRALIDGATSPLFLSSGAEDYFLSAYYFNEGNFKTPNSGLTYYDGKGTLSAYKIHDRDPILWHDGIKLVFRNCETTSGCGDLEHCPNQFCLPNTTARAQTPWANATATTTATAAATALEGPMAQLKRALSDDANTSSAPTNELALYSTLIWSYQWQKKSTPSVTPFIDTLEARRRRCLDFLVALGRAAYLSEEEELRLVSRIRGGATEDIDVVAAYATGEPSRRSARALSRLF